MKKHLNLVLAVLSGLLLAAAWPLHGFVPLIFVAFVPLLFIEHRVANGDKGNVFWLSFLTFLVWNVLTTWWVWYATPAAIAAYFLNAFFMSIVFWMFHLAKTKLYNNSWGTLILIPFWMAFEMLHYYWTAKWPWLNLGNVFSTRYTWIQWYEFTGIAGGTLWILIVNILIGNIFASISNKKSRKSLLGASVAVLFLILVPIIIGKVMYKNYEEQGEDTEVVVVQQNLDPWSEQYTATPREIADYNTSLAESVMTPKTRFIVSSESAIQEGIWLNAVENSQSVRYFQDFLHRHPQTAVVIGGTTYEFVPKGMENDFPARKFFDADVYYYVHNSALLIDSCSMQHRNKSKLTPGVEAIPSWMKFLKNFSITMAIARGTLKTDTTAENLEFGGHRVGVGICYESAFGGYMSHFAQKGADLLFVITNDGWWRDTPGHRQHFEFSKLRAIENRRCIARSANTGISGFINQRGDVLQKTKYWERDVIRETLKANRNTTFYTRHNDYLNRIAVGITGLLCLLLLIKTIYNGLKKKSVGSGRK